MSIRTAVLIFAFSNAIKAPADQNAPRHEAIWTRRGSALALARGTVALARFVNQATDAWAGPRTGQCRRDPQARARSRRSRRVTGGANPSARSCMQPYARTGRRS